MSLKDLTQDLENFIWTDTTKIGNKDNPQSFTDGNGSIVSGKKSFDRPSKSALEGMESIFGPKYSNVGTRGSYTSVDYMDGTKQGRGFTPPGGPPRGFTVDMGKSEYAIGNPLKYTLTPLSHTIAQMNSSLSYGVVPEQTINDIPIAPGAWGDYNVPLATYVSKLDVISDLSIYDSEYDRTSAYIPNITEPDLPLFRQFTRGSGGLNRIDLTSPNFDGFSFTEDAPYVLPQTIFTGPTTSPFVPFDNTPKLEHAHSVDPISRLLSYPGLYVGSQGDINETIPQPLYSTPDYGVFTGPVDAFNHTEIRSRLYDVYQHHFQPTDINFVNIPYGDNLFGEDELWKGGSIHIGSQDIASGVGGGVSYYGSLIPIVPRGSIYSSGPGGGGYRVPQEGANTLPPGGISNIPKFDGTQITLFGIYNPEDLTSQFSITNQPSGHSYDSPQIPNAYGSDFMTTPIGNSVSQYWPHDHSTSHSLTHIVHMTNQTGPTGYLSSLNVFNVDESGNLIRHVLDAHGSDFMTTPIGNSVSQYWTHDHSTSHSLTHQVDMIILSGPTSQTYQTQINTIPIAGNAHGSDFMITPIERFVSQWNDVDVQSQTHIVDMINLTGPTTQDYQTTINIDSVADGAHGSDFLTTPITAFSSRFANQNKFLKYTVHEHGFPGITTMKTMGESGNIIDGTPPTRDEVMYTTGTTTKAIFGGPIFNTEDDNIFKKFIDSDNSIRRIELNSPNYDPDGNNVFTHLDRVPYNLSDDGQYHQRAPFIIRDIGQRWGIDDGTNIDAGFIRGGVLASGERTLQDVVRIGKFLITPRGIMFGLKQFGLQLLNPRPETRLWNPLSIVGSLPPTMHMKRHLSGFLGGGQAKYGSFDNPLGEDAFYKNQSGISAGFGLIDGPKAVWGYGHPADGFGEIDDEGGLSFDENDAEANRYTTLTKKFLIDGQRFDVTTGTDDLTWWQKALNAIPTGEELGRTPAVPTQYVFSQKGAYGQGLAAKHTGYGSNADDKLGKDGDDANPGLMFSTAYWRGKAGKPWWSDFSAYRNSDTLDYQSLSYHELHPHFSYMNAFRKSDETNFDTDFGKRGGNVNAGLDTKFYSPLIQFSWRFFNSDETKDFKGGEDGWHQEDTQKLADAAGRYLDESFTSDPKSAKNSDGNLIQRYSLMTYGDISNRYEDGTELGGLAHAETELAQMGELATDIKTLKQRMVDAKVEADKMDAKSFDDKKAHQDSRIGQMSDSPHLRYDAAKEIYDAAVDSQDKAIALKLMVEKGTTVSNIGNPGDRSATIEPDSELGKIKKYNNNYKTAGTDKINMIPYGDNYGEPEDFIKFKFKDIVNNKFIIFRALLSGISDTVTPEWDATRFIGRPDDVHVYKGATRKVSFSFDIYPKTKQEFPVLLEKLNFLVGLNYPSFNNNRMVAPFIELTLGDMFNATPGYIDGVTVTPGDNSTWEMDNGLQFPKHIQVQCDFTYIGRYMPSSLGKHYELNWLEDQGWTSNAKGTSATKGTFVIGSDGEIRDELAQPERFKLRGLFGEIKPKPPTL